ncbi:hypothetical protein I2483_13850 [Sporosarcina sp. E16_3]|uniref:hypothetical protein n=1 Tax=Sporosarcina sp. E16_3 TaxID=2789293 RepID=UPI001A918459|nr:hypothetical protein [Sporosarcina sp. E16_3]MBO0602747.1 hypothetical protein [Sporosarcina sp. E16_3]
MDKKLKVNKEILFYAFRYALGRMSYAPSTIMDNIKANINDLSTGDIQAYIREVAECENYGMEMDKTSWLGFKAYLENELKIRQ